MKNINPVNGPDQHWQYSYSANSERETKRILETDLPREAALAYYMLGAKNEQYAVYHGAQFVPESYPRGNGLEYSTPLSLGVPVVLSKNPDPKYNDYNVCQIMYPVEYNIFGLGSSPVMSFKKDAAGYWQKHFYVKDYLGSTRKVVKLKLDYQNYVWTGGTRYAWRDGVPTSPSNDANFAPCNDLETNSISRLSRLGKERDLESNLGGATECESTRTKPAGF